MPKPKIILGADHGGFHLKEQAKEWLADWGYEVDDLGAHTENPVDDYPLFAFRVAEKVTNLQKKDTPALGVLFCRSGGGMVIAANKITGARAVALETIEAAKHAKLHNNANIASLAADWLGAAQAKTILKTFLETTFSQGERHERRLAQISQYEEENRSA